jgi:hypothetical protein
MSSNDAWTSLSKDYEYARGRRDSLDRLLEWAAQRDLVGTIEDTDSSGESTAPAPTASTALTTTRADRLRRAVRCKGVTRARFARSVVRPW